ncbi:acyl-CoA dehydrogenase family protein [Nocardia bovistercoris]|uniref:Acyl-CoA dehydrogenase family protein n=1 Tax=Nocardia bovistercoris TaxID=2785916 RepID=A0A931N1T6_9NOCA|nr:acyl-CoA dehydrogenase family protein [Nocardia bovistercoris]MBH0775281.1 acyl-CoA dehydrogenase family protein [Nocardia bovistercoris]
MDFSSIDLTGEQREFWDSVDEFFEVNATEEVYEQERRTGSGYNEALHKALGQRGWITPTWSRERGGAGLDAVSNRILQLEMDRWDVPGITYGTTHLVLGVVEAVGSETLKGVVLPGVASGAVRMCLGYTEPDGGSDLAGVRTRAVRTGSDWTIDGAKMFTTGAHNCQYTMLVARTDPEAPKHRGITIFLVPLDRPGVEIRPIHTVGGERTNAVFYDGVFIDDEYRLGPENQGWQVLASALQAEHGNQEADGLDELNNGMVYAKTLRTLLWHATKWARTPATDGVEPIDDPIVATLLSEIVIDLELMRSAPGSMGRILASERLIQRSAELLDMIGPRAVLSRGARGCVEDGIFEWGHRYAQGTAIYGGTTDIARNVVAQHTLGLPRPPKAG